MPPQHRPDEQMNKPVKVERFAAFVVASEIRQITSPISLLVISWKNRQQQLRGLTSKAVGGGA